MHGSVLDAYISRTERYLLRFWEIVECIELCPIIRMLTLYKNIKIYIYYRSDYYQKGICNNKLIYKALYPSIKGYLKRLEKKYTQKRTEANDGTTATHQ